MILTLVFLDFGIDQMKQRMISDFKIVTQTYFKVLLGIQEIPLVDLNLIKDCNLFFGLFSNLFRLLYLSHE